MNRGRTNRQSQPGRGRNNPVNDSVGNRQVGRQAHIPDDGIGNRIQAQHAESALDDAVGNSVDQEPTHVLRGGNSNPVARNTRRRVAPAPQRRVSDDGQRPARQPGPVNRASSSPQENRPAQNTRAPQRPRQAAPSVKKAEPVVVAYSPDSQVQRLIYLSDIFSYPLKISLEEKIASSTAAIQVLLGKISESFQVEVRVFTQEQPLVCFFVNEPTPGFLGEHAVLFALNYLVSRVINRDAENRIWFIVVPQTYELAVEQSMVIRAESKSKPVKGGSASKSDDDDADA